MKSKIEVCYGHSKGIINLHSQFIEFQQNCSAASSEVLWPELVTVEL